MTGSRIERQHDLSMPVQSVDAEAIRVSGEFSIAEVVSDFPALLQSATSEQSLDSGFSDGSNILSLRGLGAERTLVLIDGRRHVGGLNGTSSVDIGSLPVPLVERVEVLTGGASAIYGADSVTGVVNFVLRDDYEGFEVDAHYGLSEHSDGEQIAVSGIWGKNFFDDRANIVVAVDLRDDEGLKVADRKDGVFIGSARDWVNPDLRFQRGDVGESTPNFSRYYNYSNTGLIHYGLPIPSVESFSADYEGEFGVLPELTAAERALIERAADAPQRAILPQRTFPFTSGYGYIIPGNPFTGAGFDREVAIDLDNNGVPDCLDSFTGYNSARVVGGCWNVEADGTFSPVRDGLVAGNYQGFGGDSFNVLRNQMDDIVVPEEKSTINVMGRFDLSAGASLFGEIKYVYQQSETDASPNSFWDLLFGAPDNPFLPEFIRPVADATGGVAITVDPIYFGSRRRTERETVRIVSGVEGEWADAWNYEFSLNYGRYDQRTENSRQLIGDRFFASLDAVTDPATGQPACRVDVEPDAPALNTPFQIPAYEAGYFSFMPGSGDCVPLNIWAGQSGIAPEAVAWTTTDTWSDTLIDQFVASFTVAGEVPARFRLPGGAVEFVVGAEFREESSTAKRDDWQRGIIPPGSPFPAGTLLSDISENASLTFRPQLAVKNERGEYDALDVFMEIALPILSDVPFARELGLELAGRWSDYSTIGSTSSWRTNLLWIPFEGLALRGGISRAVRAPNITELFQPEIGLNFRPVDPCDAAQIDALLAEDPALGGNYLNNCVSDLRSFGLDPYDADGNYTFTDPLSASFGGVVAGNPHLQEETARTNTFGFDLKPSFVAGLTLQADYWHIEIEDAIESVSDQNIVDGCYQGTDLNPTFCGLFARNQDPTSAQFGGFNYLRTIDINFARLKTHGIDFRASYDFALGAHGLSLTLVGTHVRKLNFHTNPSNKDEVDPELGEISRPKLAGNVYLRWHYGNLTMDWHSQYMGEMLLSFVEVETARTLYGDAVFQGDTWIHDFNLRYAMTPSAEFHGGVRNLTAEKPFATDRAFPVSPRGRMFYLRAVYRLR